MEHDDCPFDRFRDWFDAAAVSGLPEPSAMALATSSRQGTVGCRMVLLKSFDRAGFVFATHFGSRKAGDLRINPRAALLFYWQPLDRQVRIEGAVTACGDEESDRLHQNRPRDSRISAWASQQSRPIPDRMALLRRWREFDRKYPDVVPRPPDWGGYRLAPQQFEFWSGGEHRLHDRLVYELNADGTWRVERLAP